MYIRNVLKRSVFVIICYYIQVPAKTKGIKRRAAISRPVVSKPLGIFMFTQQSPPQEAFAATKQSTLPSFFHKVTGL